LAGSCRALGLVKGGPAASALVLVFLTSPVLAQEPPPAEAPKPAPPAASTPSRPHPATARDKLIEQLLTEEAPEEDDLRWLYSDAEEYAPSELVGKPIPAPSLPERGEGSRRKWDPRWRRFSLGDYILTGAGFAIAGASALIPETPDRWRGKNQLDESVRDAIGITDYADGQWARDTSDVAFSLSIAYPLLVDSLIVMYWYRRSPDVASQMALITAETLAVNGAIHGTTAGFTSRERPYGRDCGTSIPGSLDDCERSKRYRSFFSGHTSVSFAAAGASCSHHIYHQVFGDPVADGLACGAALATAGLSGTMRIVGDAHYASDVAMGTAVGTLIGLGVPWLLHYGPPAQVRGGGSAAYSLNLKLVPVSNGLGVGGNF